MMITLLYAISFEGYGKIGSFQELKIRYFQAIPNATLNTPNYTCGIPKEDSFQMLRDIDPFTSSFPWLGFLIGQTLSSLTYWCAEQVGDRNVRVFVTSIGRKEDDGINLKMIALTVIKAVTSKITVFQNNLAFFTLSEKFQRVFF